MGRFLLAGVTLALAGCAGAPAAPYWEDMPGCTPCASYAVHTLAVMPFREPGLQAFLIRSKGEGPCHIFIAKSAPNRACIIKHEEHHGKCKHHPNYGKTFDCV
jgi:hypothetical protein